MLRCPGMPWVWPADCRPSRQCFGDVASFPVSFGVIPGNTCIYEHNTFIYLIYIQMSSYTYIYIHIRTYRQSVQWSEVEAAIYMQIHAYTCIYMHIPTPYVYIFQVRISAFYRWVYCIYVHIRARWKMVIWYRFPKKCMYIVCILTYMNDIIQYIVCIFNVYTYFVCIWQYRCA